MVNIETKRLIIRDNMLEDLWDLHNLMSDRNVSKYDSDFCSESLEYTRNNLALSMEEAARNDRGKFWFAMVDKKTNIYVGQIGLTILSGQVKHGMVNWPILFLGGFRVADIQLKQQREL